MLNNQLLYSAIALLFSLFGVAGLYIFLWADFIAGIQLLVYIGGINVLIIFGIMLTNKISSVRLSQTNVQQGVGAVVDEPNVALAQRGVEVGDVEFLLVARDGHGRTWTHSSSVSSKQQRTTPV